MIVLFRIPRWNPARSLFRTRSSQIYEFRWNRIRHRSWNHARIWRSRKTIRCHRKFEKLVGSFDWKTIPRKSKMYHSSIRKFQWSSEQFERKSIRISRFHFNWMTISFSWMGLIRKARTLPTMVALKRLTTLIKNGSLIMALNCLCLDWIIRRIKCFGSQQLKFGAVNTGKKLWKLEFWLELILLEDSESLVA